jgi:hypothetical protein
MACQGFVFWIREGGREERKKERKGICINMVGIRMGFMTKIKILWISSEETKIPREKTLH